MSVVVFHSKPSVKSNLFRKQTDEKKNTTLSLIRNLKLSKENIYSNNTLILSQALRTKLKHAIHDLQKYENNITEPKAPDVINESGSSSAENRVFWKKKQEEIMRHIPWSMKVYRISSKRSIYNRIDLKEYLKVKLFTLFVTSRGARLEKTYYNHLK